jgi:hypothetical protein
MALGMPIDSWQNWQTRVYRVAPACFLVEVQNAARRMKVRRQKWQTWAPFGLVSLQRSPLALVNVDPMG